VVLFRKTWQAKTGITDKAAQSGIAKTLGITFLLILVISYSTNMIIRFHPLEEKPLTYGAFHGFLAAAFYCVPLIAISYQY
jgi:hypothetical protein